MRLRTVDAAFREIKEADPDTGISKHFIRTAVTTGRVPSIRQGCKYLFRLEDLEEYIERELNRSAENYQKMVSENLARRGS